MISRLLPDVPLALACWFLVELFHSFPCHLARWELSNSVFLSFLTLRSVLRRLLGCNSWCMTVLRIGCIVCGSLCLCTSNRERAIGAYIWIFCLCSIVERSLTFWGLSLAVVCTSVSVRCQRRVAVRGDWIGVPTVSYRSLRCDASSTTTRNSSLRLKTSSEEQIPELRVHSWFLIAAL